MPKANTEQAYSSHFLQQSLFKDRREDDTLGQAKHPCNTLQTIASQSMKPEGIIVVIYSDFLQNICHGTSQNSLFKLGKACRKIFTLDLNFSREGGCTAEQHQGRGGGASFFL